jgi:hypothetical protein
VDGLLDVGYWIAKSSPTIYDRVTMNPNWRNWARVALCFVLVASLTVIASHWHRDSRGQDCGLCSVQQMPSLQTPSGNLIVVFTTPEWIATEDVVLPHESGVVLSSHGRAPPRPFVSL